MTDQATMIVLMHQSGQETDGLGKLVERRWEGEPGAHGPRRARASFTYHAFMPDPIATINPALSFETHELIMAAEAAVSALNNDLRVIRLEAIAGIPQLNGR